MSRKYQMRAQVIRDFEQSRQAPDTLGQVRTIDVPRPNYQPQLPALKERGRNDPWLPRTHAPTVPDWRRQLRTAQASSEHRVLQPVRSSVRSPKRDYPPTHRRNSPALLQFHRAGCIDDAGRRGFIEGLENREIICHRKSFQDMSAEPRANHECYGEQCVAARGKSIESTSDCFFYTLGNTNRPIISSRSRS